MPDLLSRVRLVITDVDGVLTDGGLYYSADGEVLKRFNVRDGLGIRLLQAIGVEVAVISGRSGKPLERRLSDLGIQHWLSEITDKGQACRDMLHKLSIDADDALFIGDDLNDIPAFKVCGVSAAVADAPDYVRRAATISLNTKGGAGALRELADAIVHAQGHGNIFDEGVFTKPALGSSAQ